MIYILMILLDLFAPMQETRLAKASSEYQIGLARSCLALQCTAKRRSNTALNHQCERQSRLLQSLSMSSSRKRRNNGNTSLLIPCVLQRRNILPSTPGARRARTFLKGHKRTQSAKDSDEHDKTCANNAK